MKTIVDQAVDLIVEGIGDYQTPAKKAAFIRSVLNGRWDLGTVSAKNRELVKAGLQVTITNDWTVGDIRALCQVFPGFQIGGRVVMI